MVAPHLRYKTLRISNSFLVDEQGIIKLLCLYLSETTNPTRPSFVTWANALYRLYGTEWEKKFIAERKFTQVKLEYLEHAKQQYKEWYL